MNEALALSRAQSALAGGNRSEADRICADLLFHNPDCGPAHLIRGMLAGRARRAEDAIRHLSRAAELHPDSFDAEIGLATAHRMRGDGPAAIRHGARAVSLMPDSVMAQLELGSAYLDAARLTEAAECLAAAVRLAPANFRMVLPLIHCLEYQGRAVEARRVARDLLAGGRAPVEELLRITPVLLAQGAPVAAAEFAAFALSNGSANRTGTLAVKSILARALLDGRRVAEADALLGDPSLTVERRAESTDGQALAVLGTAYQSVGRMEDARECFRAASAIPSGAGFGFYGYCHAGRITDADRRWLDEASRQATLGACTPTDLAYFHFGLGKAHEDLGEFETAMRHYAAANEAEANGRPAFRVDPKQQAARIDQMAAAFPCACAADGASASELPVFVVGMIRSGTSLVEQILSCHPEIGAAGESPFWTRNARDLMDLESGNVRSERLPVAVERYLTLMAAAAPGARRVVDKMPGNYTHLGLIHAALPNARIIHLRRSPIDTCLSIYTTHNPAFTEFRSDPANIVSGYRGYERLMAHWRTILPADRFLDVDYEDLVCDPEPAIRRIVEFCGVRWDDACLRPENSRHAVVTPSAWQVRQPIYRSSVGRWRRFEPWLGPLRELIPERAPA